MDWLSNTIGADWARALAQFVGINVGFVVVLMIVAYTVLAERRVLGFIQGRLGPNRVGPGGIFQPFADLLKFIFKEEITPSASTRFVYFLAPIIAITAALMPIIVYPFGPKVWLPFIGEFHLVIGRRDRLPDCRGFGVRQRRRPPGLGRAARKHGRKHHEGRGALAKEGVVDAGRGLPRAHRLAQLGQPARAGGQVQTQQALVFGLGLEE